MRKILLDTNIYGLIIERNAREEFQELIKNASVIIYGCSVVRKELRDVPKKEYLNLGEEIKNLRIALLNFYDGITNGKEIKIDQKTEDLANKYLRYFSEITGKTMLNHLKNDFLLVACASIHQLNLIVSEDHRTLLSGDAVRTYNNINVTNKISMPGLFTYEELKRMLRRSFPL